MQFFHPVFIKMASASVKSFRIEDILVDKNENRAEAANILASLSGECQRTATDNGRQNDNDVRDRQATSEAGSSRASTPFGGGGIVDTRKTSSTSGSPVSSSEDDRSDKSSAAEERRPSTEIKYNAAAATLPSGFYHPFTGFPMGFPLANMPGAGTSASLTETGSAIRNFPPGMFPGNFDALRQNRFLYGGPPSALLLPTMPRLSHPGHLPQGAGYPIYPNFTGLFGLPLAGGLPGYPDKGRLPGDRDNCKAFIRFLVILITFILHIAQPGKLFLLKISKVCHDETLFFMRNFWNCYVNLVKYIALVQTG